MVIGSGPNALVAACVIARAGLDVLVLERNPSRPGGAVGSVEATRPGFVHDVGAAFFPWGSLSPAFQSLRLESHGLVWKHGRFESCHPAPDESYACIARDADLTAKHFGDDADGQTWRELTAWYQSIEPRLLQVLLRPFLAIGATARLGPANLLRLGRVFSSRPDALARRLFRSEAARRVLPGLGLHVDVGPEDRFGAALGFMLGMTATTGSPQGGELAATSVPEHVVVGLSIASHGRATGRQPDADQEAEVGVNAKREGGQNTGCTSPRDLADVLSILGLFDLEVAASDRCNAA